MPNNDEVTVTPVDEAIDSPPEASATWPEALEGEIRMTRKDAALKRRTEFREQKCYGYYPPEKHWLTRDGRTLTREYATVFTVADAVSRYVNECVLYILPPEDPSKPRRKCNIESLLLPDTIKMIKLAPKNSTFRAKVMSDLNEMPPSEADTYEKIKDWIEFNFPRSVEIKPAAKSNLSITANATYVETGSCTYTTRERASGVILLTEEEVTDIINASQHLDGVMERIHELIEQKTEELPRHVVTEDHGDYEREELNLDDDGVDYSVANVRGFARRLAERIIAEDRRRDYGLE